MIYCQYSLGFYIETLAKIIELIKNNSYRKITNFKGVTVNIF